MPPSISGEFGAPEAVAAVSKAIVVGACYPLYLENCDARARTAALVNIMVAIFLEGGSVWRELALSVTGELRCA